MKNIFKKNDIVLFQGDSITDGARDKESDDCLGWGYTTAIGAVYACNFPEMGIRFINKGISGDRVIDLLNRVDKDFIEIRPSWISILIGANDCWRRYDNNDPTPVEVYEERYRSLLEKLKKSLSVNIVLCEPFLLPEKPEQEKWREDMEPKIDSVRKLAKEFDTFLVPLDSVLQNAAKLKSKEYYSKDGIHPTPAGHVLIAQTWLEALGRSTQLTLTTLKR